MTRRSALQFAIRELVEGYAASHKVIDLNRAALALFSRYPECGMTIEEVVREIEKGAIENKGVLFSDRKNEERR